MRGRYAIVCLLAGVGVGATYGALAGLVGALAGGPQDGQLLGLVLGAVLAGLILGAALGALLGGVCGLLATVVARGTTDPTAAAARVGGTALVTSLAMLLLVSGLGGSLIGDGGLGWSMPGGLRWVGVVVPSVLTALVAAWAARSVADLAG